MREDACDRATRTDLARRAAAGGAGGGLPEAKRAGSPPSCADGWRLEAVARGKLQPSLKAIVGLLREAIPP